MLFVKKLYPDAKLPTLAHPGEDTCYDLYALYTCTVPPHSVMPIRTGIAIQFDPPAGACIRCRSGLARSSFDTRGGEIDAGYRGDVTVLFRNDTDCGYVVHEHDKIAQMRKVPIATDLVVERAELAPSRRGESGFGSTGR